MKELVVISGKGGTGKTSITASFAALNHNLKNKNVIVDCDVDAADMHLLLKPEIVQKEDFYGGKKANINKQLCTTCKKCLEICKFNAISEDFDINPTKCEGCKVCVEFCPAKAIEFNDCLSGEWYESDTRFGKLIHAKLGIAEQNSGKLVTKIRNHARLIAHRNSANLIICDGPPGTGCPVIASISGANMVLIVTEPTMSGLHDAKRIFELTRHFKIPAKLCINKFDINLQITEETLEFCKNNKIEVVGKIPYSKDFINAQIKGQTIVEYTNNETTNHITQIWNKISVELGD